MTFLKEWDIFEGKQLKGKFQLQEADVDGDGSINYEEFVRTILQTYFIFHIRTILICLQEILPSDFHILQTYFIFRTILICFQEILPSFFSGGNDAECRALLQSGWRLDLKCSQLFLFDI